MNVEHYPSQRALPGFELPSVYTNLGLPGPSLTSGDESPDDVGEQSSRPQDQDYGGYTPEERAELFKVEEGGRRDTDG